MISSEDKWLYQYTLPCTFGKEEIFQKIKQTGKFVDFLNNDFSRENIRNYFFGPHNQKAHDSENFHHMVIPYQVIEINQEDQSPIGFMHELHHTLPEDFRERTFNEDDLEKASQFRIITQKPKLGDIIIAHADFIVDIN